MSEPQRQSKPAATDEPAEGIGAPQTVPPEQAAASAQQTDPGGYPHQPAASVPDVPGDEPLVDHDRREDSDEEAATDERPADDTAGDDTAGDDTAGDDTAGDGTDRPRP